MSDTIRESARVVLAQVQENSARLDSCVHHDFVNKGEQQIFDKLICVHCGGEVDGHAAYWYRKGVKAGQRGGQDG